MTCRVCGRQVEVSDGGQPMPCVCIKTPMGDVLRYILADCVGPAAPPEQPEEPAKTGPRPAVLANIRRGHRREEWD